MRPSMPSRSMTLWQGACLGLLRAGPTVVLRQAVEWYVLKWSHNRLPPSLRRLVRARLVARLANTKYLPINKTRPWPGFCFVGFCFLFFWVDANAVRKQED